MISLLIVRVLHNDAWIQGKTCFGNFKEIALATSLQVATLAKRNPETQNQDAVAAVRRVVEAVLGMGAERNVQFLLVV